MTPKVPTPCFDRPFSIDTPLIGAFQYALKSDRTGRLTAPPLDRQLVAQIFPKVAGTFSRRSLCHFHTSPRFVPGIQPRTHHLRTRLRHSSGAICGDILAQFPRGQRHPPNLSHLVIEAFKLSRSRRAPMSDQFSRRTRPTVVQCSRSACNGYKAPYTHPSAQLTQLTLGLISSPDIAGHPDDGSFASTGKI